MRHRWKNADMRVVESIRAAYVERPWTTAAGLATLFGVPLADGITAVMGGWTGRSGLTSVSANNLALERSKNRVAIQERIGARGTVRLEPDLEHGAASAVIARRARRPARTRKGARQKKFERHLATYEPLVGASVRAARRAQIKVPAKSSAPSAAP